MPMSSAISSAHADDPAHPLRLQHIAGSGPEEILLIRRTNIIGSAEECDIVGLRLQHAAICPRHAALEHGGGTWFIADLGSISGTYLNGQRLAPDTRMPLAHGDSVRLASAVYRVDLGAGAIADIPTLDDAAAPGAVRRAAISRRSPLEEVLDGIIAASAAIHSAPDEASLWQTLLASALDMTGHQRGAILRRAPGPAAASGVEICASLDLLEADDHLHFSRALICAALDGEPVFLQPTADDPRPADTHITTAACVPLMMDGGVWGVLYLDSRGRAAAPATGRWARTSIEEACRALGQIGSLALSSVLRRQMQHRLAILQRDAELAAQAQHLLLPPAQGRIGCVEFALRFRPGLAVSGDVVGIARLDNHRTAAFIGDVTGKGLGAGLVMATIQGYLNASLLRHDDAADAMNDLNHHLAERLPPGCFASLWLCVLDASRSTLTAVDAGHGSGLLLMPGSASVFAASGGPWLGAVPDMRYQSSTIRLHPGHRLVLVSDGLLEQPGRDGAPFGIERARQSLAHCATVSDDVEALLLAVQDFTSTSNYRDDLTVLSLTFTDQQ